MPKFARERRKEQRLKSTFLVKYQTESSSFLEHLTNIRDVSTSGLCFVTKEPLRTGDEIKLTVLIPTYEAPISAQARVIRVMKSRKRGSGYSVAVAFTEITQEAKDAMKEFVKEFTKKHRLPFFVDLPGLVMR